MNRAAALAIYLGPTALISLGYSFDFNLRTMRWSTLVCLLAAGPAFIYLLLREKASPVDKAMTGYLALAFLGFWLWPGGLGRLFSAHPAAVLYLVFLLAAAVPPLFGGLPFTEFWARRRTPEPVWETEIFKTINRRMSLVWVLLFILCGLAALAGDLIPALDAPVWKIALGVGLPLALLAGLGAPFNRWYPDYYQRRLGLAPVRPPSAPAGPETAKAAEKTVTDADPDKQKGETEMTDRTDAPKGAQAARSCKELISHMPSALDPAAAAGLTADLQFEISGGEEFTAFLHLEDGKAVFNEGPSPSPSLTIKSPAEVWLAISRGELDGQQAFMSGQFRAEGDFSLLMRLSSLFKR